MSRDAICDLVHRYADAVVRRDTEAWAATWALAARWSLVPGREVVGRDAVVELWTRAMAGFDAVVQQVHAGTCSLHGDAGAGRWQITEHTRRRDGAVGLLLASYEDAYVVEAGAWRFSARSLVVHYQGPPDLSGTFAAP